MDIFNQFLSADFTLKKWFMFFIPFVYYTTNFEIAFKILNEILIDQSKQNFFLQFIFICFFIFYTYSSNHYFNSNIYYFQIDILFNITHKLIIIVYLSNILIYEMEIFSSLMIFHFLFLFVLILLHRQGMDDLNNVIKLFKSRILRMYIDQTRATVADLGFDINTFNEFVESDKIYDITLNLNEYVFNLSDYIRNNIGWDNEMWKKCLRVLLMLIIHTLFNITVYFVFDYSEFRGLLRGVLIMNIILILENSYLIHIYGFESNSKNEKLKSILLKSINSHRFWNNPIVLTKKMRSRELQQIIIETGSVTSARSYNTGRTSRTDDFALRRKNRIKYDVNLRGIKNRKRGTSESGNEENFK